jgi:Flp pilus assembly protein TadG
MFKRLRQLLRGGRGEEGVAAVELAIVISLLLLLIIGGMDLAHMYYTDYVVTNASREGARWATKYTVKADGTPNPPPTQEQVSYYVKYTLNYNSLNLPNFKVDESKDGNIVTVTATAEKHWWLLGRWLGFTDPMTLIGKTAMAMENP